MTEWDDSKVRALKIYDVINDRPMTRYDYLDPDGNIRTIAQVHDRLYPSKSDEEMIAMLREEYEKRRGV
jgi:hypothetical protein